jgi:peptidoglycan/LPS O-acetylase OafA/YrhL
MGIAIAMLYRADRGHWSLMLLATVPLALWIYLGESGRNSVLVGLSLAFIILPVARLEAQGRLSIPPLLTFLGAASYSIYLAHVVCVSAAARLVEGRPYWLITSFTAAAGIAGGLAYYFIVERSLLRVAPGDRRHQRLTGEEPLPAAFSEVVEASPRSSVRRPKRPKA